MSNTVTAKAPGRVEIIGNHTDHSKGWVMPAAITAYTIAEGSRTSRKVITLHSQTLASHVEDIPLSILEKDPTEIRGIIEERDAKWTLYPLGVIYFYNKEIAPITCGLDIAFRGDLPLNAGLSSSASIEVVTENILKQLFAPKTQLSLKDEALLCQKAENEVVGAKCGVMDQFAVLNGGLTFLDCGTLEHETLTLPAGYVIGVLNTGVKHSVAGVEYTERREQCEAAARYLEVECLRDATLSLLGAKDRGMDPTLYKRAHHVITENTRVRRLAALLRGVDETTRDKYESLFIFMRASHLSSRHQFENSCEELDVMAETCWEHKLAARLSGGGFGGSVVTIIKQGQEAVLDLIVDRYMEKIAGKTVHKPTKHVYQVAQGAYMG